MEDKSYLYVILDPRKCGNYVYNDLNFEYEPIYVGVGKNNRAYQHYKMSTDGYSKSNGLKLNKLKKIYEIFGELVNEYIIFPYSGHTREFVLEKEKYYIETIGTINDVFGIKNRGPLTNLMMGGQPSPNLCGESNPMYGRTFYDVWKEKGLDVDDLREKKLLKTLGKPGWYSKASIEKQNEFRDKLRIALSGDSHYKRKYSEDELIVIEEKRKKSWHETVDNRDDEFKKILSEKLSNGLKEYNKNLTPERKEELNKKITESSKIYFNKYWNSEEVRIERNKNMKAGKELFYNDEERFNKFIEKVSGENNYFKKSGYKTRYEYMLNKHGKDAADEYREKMSENSFGEKNSMWNNGHRIAGSKNGRAIMVIIHFPTGEKYFCHGTYKKFKEEVLSKIKPSPARFCEYGIENRGWFIGKINNIEEIDINNYIIYE